MALSAGARLDPYEITAPIGVGGMGERFVVIRVHDRQRDVPAAALSSARAPLRTLAIP
jgi:hypothetical protein